MTPKQEAFCLAYIETGNASEAYRRAYDAGKMKAETINKRASELLADGEISGRLAELVKPAVEAVQITLQSHLEALREIRDKALAEGKYGPAATAEIARGKASRLYVEAVEHSGPNGQPISFKGDVKALTDEELDSLIRLQWNKELEVIRDRK